MSNINLIKEYKENSRTYSSLEQVTKGLISTLISNAGIDIHSITSRVKNESSLLGKISRPDKNYKSITELTDIVGIRITTYFSDHVDLISNLIEDEFIIDDENSIDKRKAIDPDRFGYMSLHLVAEHALTRTNLPEYTTFKGLKFEIQIRTILQHAWAEIEHDIGYKSRSQVPSPLRRRFSRLSGLLELADEEFLGIRSEIQDYREELVSTIPDNPSSVLLDLDSIESLVNTDARITDLEKNMLLFFNCTLEDSTRDNLSRSLSFLNLFGIETIKDLQESYDEVEPYIIPFVKVWLNYPDDEKTFTSINKGISLLYLCYVLLALRNDEKLYEVFVTKAPFINPEEIPNRVKETFNKIK